MTSASPGRRTSFGVVVRADLDEALVSALGALRLRVDVGGPVALRGEFKDRAELLGALQALEELGVELVEVTQQDDPAPSDPGRGRDVG
ncbi:hypothetical protein FE697_009495 [Mumia zhuanghuii]|uniref:BON domain-containing protein n=2 Tax=Mumia TaxID=1546255 RepID=A0ABW1QPR3_9ACTN|nr:MULTISPECIES: hypothetical protein [Mumia]KAA1423788.1 hypothetical protein FE697_009495 [Mumia zhuanghuii]